MTSAGDVRGQIPWLLLPFLFRAGCSSEYAALKCVGNSGLFHNKWNLELAGGVAGTSRCEIFSRHVRLNNVNLAAKSPRGLGFGLKLQSNHKVRAGSERKSFRSCCCTLDCLSSGRSHLNGEVQCRAEFLVSGGVTPHAISLYASTGADGKAVLNRSGADSLAVGSAGGSARASCQPGTTGALAGHCRVFIRCLTQGSGVVSIEINLIFRTVKRESDCFLCL